MKQCIAHVPSCSEDIVLEGSVVQRGSAMKFCELVHAAIDSLDGSIWRLSIPVEDQDSDSKFQVI